MKYPPPAIAASAAAYTPQLRHQANDYFAHANDELLTIIQCEHIQAVENADSIFSVPGIDAIFVGPNDLAASMRSKDGKPPSGDAMNQAMKHILDTCRKHKVPAGVHCYSPEEARTKIEEGWQFRAVGSELRMMLDAAGSVIKKLGGQQQAEAAKY